MPVARPQSLRLDMDEQPWRSAPMPGADRPIELVRLASAGDSFAMLGRFPAGFARPVEGGYAATEEFLVLRGALELEGTTASSGTLCFIPAHHVRSPMRSPNGATVLAWFSGPPLFRSAGELSGSPASSVAMVAVRTAQPGTLLLRTTEADWRVLDPQALTAAGQPVDAVDLDFTRWARVGPGAPPCLGDRPLLVRLRPAGDEPR